MLSVIVVFLLYMSRIITGNTPQAPGDEDATCFVRDSDSVNREILMASFNYRNLLEDDGGPWTVVDADNNNQGSSINTVRL